MADIEDVAGDRLTLCSALLELIQDAINTKFRIQLHITDLALESQKPSL